MATRMTASDGIRTPAVRRSARDRLLEAADELFYAEGVQSVGIDRVIEHAGVAKASLYNAFRSKDELIHAYLLQRHASIVGRVAAAAAKHEDPRAKVMAVFESQAEAVRAPGFRGCAFANASAEAKPGGPVEQATHDYRTWLRDLFTDLAERGGARDPELLGRQLHLLYDGATTSSNLDRDPKAASAARTAAAALWDAAIA
jgi:AcrR family transcriptional regulator